MTEIDIARHASPLEPALRIWGWEIPAYLFLGGLAAGVMILSSVLALRVRERSPAARWLSLAPPALVTLGMGALLLDLSHKAFAWRFYLAFRWSSPMSWGAWILVLVYPVTLLFGAGALAEGQWQGVARLGRRLRIEGALERARALAFRRARPLAWLHLGTGVALGLYTGILLSTLGARALWASALLGPLFLVSGLSTGAALLALFPVAAEERHLVVRSDLLAICLELVLLLLLLAGLATSGAAGREAARLLLGGRYTAEFWTLVVIAGLLVPLLFGVLETWFHRRAVALAPLLVLGGGLALRFILVAAGQA